MAAIGDKTALLVGCVSDDGEPFATRGWGLTVVDADRPRCRLVLAADDLPALVRRGGRGLFAVTVTNVFTLASVQLKGPAGDFVPATDDDLATVEDYCDRFFGAIFEIDGIPRALMDRQVPLDFIACEIEVEQLYDQTPGPRAGSPVQQ